MTRGCDTGVVVDPGKRVRRRSITAEHSPFILSAGQARFSPPLPPLNLRSLRPKSAVKALQPVMGGMAGRPSIGGRAIQENLAFAAGRHPRKKAGDDFFNGSLKSSPLVQLTPGGNHAFIVPRAGACRPARHRFARRRSRALWGRGLARLPRPFGAGSLGHGRPADVVLPQRPCPLEGGSPGKGVVDAHHRRRAGVPHHGRPLGGNPAREAVAACPLSRRRHRKDAVGQGTFLQGHDDREEPHEEQLCEPLLHHRRPACLLPLRPRRHGRRRP